MSLLVASETSIAANEWNIQLAQAPLSQTPTVPPDSDLPQTPLLLEEPSAPPPSTTPLPPIEDFLESPPELLPDSTEPDSTTTFAVEQFQIEGNTAIEEEELQAELAAYRARPITFADLLEIESRLTRLYQDRGYINSGVVIPTQDVNDGVIVVRVIEGTIEEIEINVDGRLSEDYIRSRLRRGTKAPLNINELQEALQLLQLNPLIESLNAELAVGSSRERWILAVDVNQANAFRPSLFINNSRPPSVGSFQRGVDITHNNFAGEGDRFSFIYKNTDGSNDFDTNYVIPFNSLDGTISLRYRYVESDIIEEPFDELDIESETDEYEVVLRQPIIVTADARSTQELAVGVEFSRQANSTTLEDEPFPLSPGAGEMGDDIGETKISALRFFQDWTQRTRSQVLAARSQFSVGVDLFDATINQNAPDSSFVSWRGQIQWLRQLNSRSNINLLLRSDIQLTTSDLVPLEQFSLGGIDSVRGYRQDALLGNNGVFVSAELRVPIYRWSNGFNSLSIIPFADFGTVWGDSEDNFNRDEDTLVSLGVGLQLALNESLRARLDWGIPLIEVEDRDNTLQEDGIYFSVEYFPF
ncbi:ShlB/FhaC/HecB family hemolysin secretion/activation protein [Myxosarcina sp. GI1(2024)]